MRWHWVKITTLALMMSLAGSVCSQTRQPCAVLRVIEGQHIELRSGATFRLAGVQALSNFSSQNLSFLAFLDSVVIGKTTELELDESLPETFGYLWRDSSLINVELLQHGWMQVWEDTARFKYRDVFLAAENAARQNKVGLWGFEASQTVDDTVYITKSGKKYHHADCRLLSKNRIALPLSQARADHEACSLCGALTTSSPKALSLQSDGKAATVQCWGKTKKGDRCKREAEAGTKYCWQHRRK